VLLVLGCRPQHNGRPSAFMVDRARKAVSLFKKNNYSKVLLSGGKTSLKVPEADLMRVMLLNHIPETRIMTECNSKSTIQNAVFCWELLKDNDVKSVTVVTSQFHIPRTKFIFKKLYAHMGSNLKFEPAPDSLGIFESGIMWLREFYAIQKMRLFGF